MKFACLLLLVGLAAVAVGCGQKGPLVLPDAQRPHRKITAPRPPSSPAPAPAAPAGLPSTTAAPTDPTDTGEAASSPAPPR